MYNLIYGSQSSTTEGTSYLQIQDRHSTGVQTCSLNLYKITTWMPAVNSLSDTSYNASDCLECWPFVRIVRPASLHQFCQLLWAVTVSHHRTKWWILPGSHTYNDLCTINKSLIIPVKHIFLTCCVSY
jgi:hypothetical protein